VTRDGAETDLDLGHYERFIDEELTQASSLMSGRVLLKVIQDERDGKYEGRSVPNYPPRHDRHPRLHSRSRPRL